MRTIKMFARFWIVTAALFAACAAPPAPEESDVSVPTSEPADEEITAATIEPQPTIEVSALEPQRVDFQSGDATSLVGTYWPPAESPSPGIILMHMMGKDKTSWQTLPALLQGVGIAHEGTQRRNYAVFAFDFRGHGESGGSPANRPNMLEDAKAAQSTFRALPGVDAERIVLIGASIGADAAVDTCSEGCIGAIALSPGGFLGIPYPKALQELGNKPVLCVASEGDALSAVACRAGEQAGLSDYSVQIYTGSFHGTDIFNITDQQPMLTDLIFQWLTEQ